MTEHLRDDLDPQFNKPFVEHLDDLRKTVFNSVILLVVGLVIAIPCAPFVLALAKVPMAKAGKDPEQFLQVIHIAGGFLLGMRVIFWTGILFSAPLIVINIAHFIVPGLKKRERAGVGLGLWSAALLFVAGALLCYYVTLPVAITMMFTVNGWLGIVVPWVELSDYVSFVLKLLIAFGAAFELPVVILTLGSIGVVSSKLLRQYRKHAMVGILVSAMILTPPDIFTQVLMALPMIILYEVCVWMIYFKEKRKAKSRT